MVYLPDGNISGGMELQSCDSEILAVDAWQKEKAKFGTSLLNNSTCGHFSGGLGNDKSGNGKPMMALVNASEVGYPYRIQHHFNFVDDVKYQYLFMAGTKVSKAVWSREINFNIFQSPTISTMAKMDNDNTSTRNINLLAAGVGSGSTDECLPNRSTYCYSCLWNYIQRYEKNRKKRRRAIAQFLLL